VETPSADPIASVPGHPGEAEGAEPGKRSRRALVAGVVTVLILASGVGLWLRRSPSHQASSPGPAATGSLSRVPPSPAVPSNPPSASAGTNGEGTATDRAPKSIEDLKVSPITLEKAKGSSLIYAVGTLRNTSAHQRFGIQMELDLLDAGGGKVGVAKDYRSVLEPGQEWHFRGLVLVSKAASARVRSIREDE
jgi:hypothetical protein